MNIANGDKLEFVSAIITDKEKRPLILKRCNNLKLDPGKYDMCSGHMKYGEIPMQSMYRELQEELGMNPNNIIKMQYLKDIQTPHPKLKGTVSHIYYVETNLTEEEINNNILQANEREIENVKYLKSIGELMAIQIYTDEFRTPYTKQMDEVYQMIQINLNNRKEQKCQER